ncbi:MAG: nuclear transport factor 2 family protein [Flavobacteriaceae bacterium]|nr:nuclear transport factor 2 family protein [Flavobacteriaceae bacterium]
MRSKKEIAETYIQLLQMSEIEQLIDLFSEDSVIDSPIYGHLDASVFFNRLKDDTSDSILKIHGIYERDDALEIALYFEYLWKLKNGKSVTFDVIDIMKFDEKNKITYLKIIYDTVKARSILKET